MAEKKTYLDIGKLDRRTQTMQTLCVSHTGCSFNRLTSPQDFRRGWPSNKWAHSQISCRQRWQLFVQNATYCELLVSYSQGDREQVPRISSCFQQSGVSCQGTSPRTKMKHFLEKEVKTQQASKYNCSHVSMRYSMTLALESTDANGPSIK